MPPSSNSPSSVQQTLLHTHSESMNKLQDFVFKLARAPQAETLLRDSLQRFVSDYKTPDHPPYSAMIQNALEELNEKWGSSEESISKYLEKRYEDLPWAHSALLKHHLQKTCESGDIVLTRAEKYQLVGSLKLGTGSKRKLRRKKWRWDCDRQKHRERKKKSNLSRKKNQLIGEKVEGIKKHDETEKRLAENKVYGEHMQEQMKSEPSSVDPTYFLTEPPGVLAAANGKKYPEEARPQLENGPCAIAKVDIWAARAHDQEKEQSEQGPGELSSPERPPGFELVLVKNLYLLGSTEPEPEPASSGEVIGSMQTLKEPICYSTRKSESGAETKLKAQEYDSLQFENLETPSNQQQTLALLPISLKQMNHEKKQPQLIKADTEEVVPKITVHRRQGRLLRQRPRDQPPPKPVKAASMDELPDPKVRKLRILLKQPPEAADVENQKVVGDCREQEFKQSIELATYEKMKSYKKAEVLLLDNSKQSPEVVIGKLIGKPLKRRSPRVLNKV